VLVPLLIDTFAVVAFGETKSGFRATADVPVCEPNVKLIVPLCVFAGDAGSDDVPGADEWPPPPQPASSITMSAIAGRFIGRRARSDQQFPLEAVRA